MKNLIILNNENSHCSEKMANSREILSVGVAQSLSLSKAQAQCARPSMQLGGPHGDSPDVLDWREAEQSQKKKAQSREKQRKKQRNTPSLSLSAKAENSESTEPYLSLAVRARQHSPCERGILGESSEASADKLCAASPPLFALSVSLGLA